jgi:hypothetical protein
MRKQLRTPPLHDRAPNRICISRIQLAEEMQ